jgi:hypothetical protein
MWGNGIRDDTTMPHRQRKGGEGDILAVKRRSCANIRADLSPDPQARPKDPHRQELVGRLRRRCNSESRLERHDIQCRCGMPTAGALHRWLRGDLNLQAKSLMLLGSIPEPKSIRESSSRGSYSPR